MAQLDSIWNRARLDLLITTEHGDLDVYLWEHAERVARCAQQICRFQDVKTKDPDELAVMSAALYHDAACSERVRDGELRRCEVHIAARPDGHWERSAAILEQSLATLLPAGSLDRAVRAVRATSSPKTDSIEALIVTEAENLDSFGLLSLWSTIRRGTLEGKGVQAAIDTWHRRAEYQYWPALLKDSFQFESVRAVAQRRLEKLERFMVDLQEQQASTDLAESAPRMLDRSTTSAPRGQSL